MKRNSNFLIAFAAALVTFATLSLTVGPKRFENPYRNNHWYGAQNNKSDNSCVTDDMKKGE